MSVESLHTRQQLSVVSAGDQDLGVRPNRSLQNGERAGCELVLFELCDLILAVTKSV
jgi:hypothetical protein